jgi:hypothetical protein
MLRTIPPATLLILLIVLSPLSFAQSATSGAQVQSAAQTASFAGCYELNVGRWWPWGLGEDGVSIAPPKRVRLLAERGTKGFEQDGFLIRAMPVSKSEPSGRARSAYWQVKFSDQVNLIWTDGFTGIRMKLEKESDGLSGWANPISDVQPLIPRVAHVTARRIPCEGPQ